MPVTNLSTKGLFQIPISPERRDFAFVVGNQRYPCTSFSAEFLAPIIAAQHGLDLSIDECIIQTPDPQDLFARFLDLSRGQPLEWEASTAQFFLALAKELGNSELYRELSSHLSGTMTTSNILERLHFGSGSRELSFVEVEHLAAHFWQFDQIIFNEFNLDQLQQILSQDCLELQSDDQLCDFILWHLDSDREYFRLFDFVQFEFMSVPAMSRFTETVRDKYDLLTPSLWQSMLNRLTHSVSSQSPSSRLHWESFPFESESPLKGIIAELTRRCEGIVHDQGLVSVTASSTERNYFPKHVVDFSSDTVFGSGNRKDAWLCFDFRQFRIRATHYSLKTFHKSQSWNPRHPISWAIEVSDDGSEWREVDRHSDCPDLAGDNRIGTFEISQPSSSRFIRILQTGPSHIPGDFCLELAAVEFFGSIVELSRPVVSEREVIPLEPHTSEVEVPEEPVLVRRPPGLVRHMLHARVRPEGNPAPGPGQGQVQNDGRVVRVANAVARLKANVLGGQ
jgi:hypothetical protein